MHASTARSLKRDGWNHSPSVKQPAVVASLLFDISDIHISVWHHQHFRIVVWYLADDCLPISAIAGKETPSVCSHRVTTRTKDNDHIRDESFLVAGAVIWNSLPAALRTATLSPVMFNRHQKAQLFGWSIARLRTIYDALYKSTHHHHHHHHHHISDYKLQHSIAK